MVSPTDGSGVLVGLACGDALGEPVEGWSGDRIAAEHGTLTDFVGGRVPPGGLTRRVLARIADGKEWEDASRNAWNASPEGRNAGNESVMRCAPLAVAFAADLDHLAVVRRTSSKVTHYDPRCVYWCEVLNRTIAQYLRGESTPLKTALTALPQEAPQELVQALEPIPEDINPESFSPTGYVVDTLQVALYQALTADSAETAIVNAVNMGGDTDTIGAVAGAIAGARFGGDDLPARWIDHLDRAAELRDLGQELATL